MVSEIDKETKLGLVNAWDGSLHRQSSCVETLGPFMRGSVPTMPGEFLPECHLLRGFYLLR